MTLTRARMLVLCAATALVCSTPVNAVADTTSPPDPSLQQRVTRKEPTATGRVEIGAGHVDIGPRLTPTGWELMARDDTGKAPTWRHLDDVLVRVHDSARTTIPQGDQYSFLGLEAGARPWVVPQTENRKVVWLGWNTQDPGVTGSTERGVTLDVAGMSGPGRLGVFLQNGFDAPQPLWHGALDQPVWVDLNTHTHANWVFSAPGTYVVALRVTGKGTDGRVRQAVGRVRFAVGDAVRAADAFAAPAPPIRKGAPPTQAVDGAAAQRPVEEEDLWPTLLAAGVGMAIALVVAGVVAGCARGRSRRRAAEAVDG